MLTLRIPPDFVALLVVGAMWLASRLGGDVFVAEQWRLGGAIFFLGLGMVLIILARVQFAQRSTTFSPIEPSRATHLVVDGVYRISRNPMYVGTWCVLFALAVWWANWYAALVSFVYVWYIDRFQIRPEEAILSSKFGREYDVYTHRVRRWV